MTDTQLPYRADIVGSFLRPPALAEARARHAAGELDAEGLRVAEDTAIAELVVQQADAGLQLATDGEFRRSWWHFDFFGLLDGVELHFLGGTFGLDLWPPAIKTPFGRLGFAE